MSTKRKKTTSWEPRHIYTTREIMEITEQRRLEQDAAAKELESKTKTSENKPAPVLQDLNPPLLLPVTDNPRIIEEIKTFTSQVNVRPSQEIKKKDPLPDDVIRGLFVFILSLPVFLFMVSFKFPESWVNTVAAKLNAVIVDGSFFVLSIIQVSCTVMGAVLKSHHYKVSLQGDLVAFYSIELLIVFAALFALAQKTTWIKRGVIFISLIPLAIIANICRVLLACGLALNYGIISADRYYHGILVGFVFIFIVLGLMFFAFLFSPDSNRTDLVG